MEISKIRPYERYYDNSIGRVTGNSGSDQISNPIENFSTGKMQSVKPRSLYEAYEKGTKEEIKAETKSEIYGIVHKWRQEYEKYGR